MRSNTHTKSQSKRAILLFGPTASGKTEIVSTLFGNGYEIISADSVQVYKYLDIGSAKPSKELMERIPHHLVDFLSPEKEFTVADFVSAVDKTTEDIWDRGNIPVIAGGTAFYFKNWIYGLSKAPASDPVVRNEVLDLLEREGKGEIHKRLIGVDPVSAKRINPNDSYRLTRALEVYIQTGKPLSSFLRPTEPRLSFEPLLIGLGRDKAELDERIKMRVEMMFSEGLVDEFRMLMRMGATESWPSMSAIGYREFFQALGSGEYGISGIKDLICVNSKKYAKRQMTFFRSFKGVNWFHPDDKAGIKGVISQYLGT